MGTGVRALIPMSVLFSPLCEKRFAERSPMKLLHRVGRNYHCFLNREVDPGRFLHMLCILKWGESWLTND